MRTEIKMDLDDWIVFRLAALREDRTPAQLRVVVDEDHRITDAYIIHADGVVEHAPVSAEQFCRVCGRKRPNYIFDPNCSRGGYCDWIERPPQR